MMKKYRDQFGGLREGTHEIPEEIQDETPTPCPSCERVRQVLRIADPGDYGWVWISDVEKALTGD